MKEPCRYISAYVLHWRDTVDDEAIAMLEHFTVLLYNMDSIDEVHQQYCQYRISSQAGHGHVNGISTTNSTTSAACTSAACHEGGLSWGQALMPFLPFHLQVTGLGRSTKMETTVDYPS